jgi:hypothetical protein
LGLLSNAVWRLKLSWIYEGIKGRSLRSSIVSEGERDALVVPEKGIVDPKMGYCCGREDKV